ncbi:MAG TPA: 50S ribosomal protein L15 [Spirochaetia bacterium]|nr:50S ribosomal protein L15 [Spirochaetales bacterium]HRS65488.1 50S ribosomal protein L15 [Spirochaetia bacterium]
MAEFDIHPPAGAKKKKVIIGRGRGSGLGGTAGKGNKGQQSRSGGKTYPGFEGGQMPLYRRIAHRGFDNTMFAVEYQIVNLSSLEKKYAAGETVNNDSLKQKNLIKHSDKPVKLLAKGKVTKALTVDVDKVSEAAKKAIESAGGKIVTHE